MAIGWAHGLITKKVIPGSALRQPGEKTCRGKAGQVDEGTGTGLAQTVSSTWRTHIFDSFLCEVQSIARGKKELPNYQDALDSFSPSSEFSQVMASQDKCRASSLFHL